MCIYLLHSTSLPRALHSFPTRRSSDLGVFDTAYVDRIRQAVGWARAHGIYVVLDMHQDAWGKYVATPAGRSEEHTSELQSLRHLVCRLLLETKKRQKVRVRKKQKQ